MTPQERIDYVTTNLKRIVDNPKDDGSDLLLLISLYRKFRDEILALPEFEKIAIRFTDGGSWDGVRKDIKTIGAVVCSD